MQIQNVNSMNFNSKERFLTEDGLHNFQALKKKMKQYTSTIILSKDSYCQDKLGYIKTDNTFLLNMTPNEVIIGSSKMIIDDSGKVDIIKKPFLKSKNSLLKKLDLYLAIFNNMFNIDRIVEKKRLLYFFKYDKESGKTIIEDRKWIN